MKGWAGKKVRSGERGGKGQIFLFLISLSFPLLPNVSKVHFSSFLLAPTATFSGNCPACYHKVHPLDTLNTAMFIFSANVPHTCSLYELIFLLISKENK